MKKLIALLLALVMLLSLAACGGQGNDNSTPADDSANTAAPEQNNDANADAEDEVIEPIEIEFWYQTNAAFDQAIGTLADAFNASNDKGITVKVSGYDSSALESSITAGMMDGSAPTMFYTRSNAYFSNLCAEGVLEDLTSYNLNLTDAALTAATHPDGGLYAAALGYSPICLAYNKAIFDELNIAVPTNFNELKTAVETLKAAGYGGITYPGGMAGHVWLSRSVFHTTMGTKGYKDLEEGIDAGTITELPADAVKALHTMSDLGKLLTDGADTMQYDVMNTMFSTGETGMVFLQPSNLITSEAFADIDAGILPVYGESTNGNFYGEITFMISVNANATDAEKTAAVEFIRYVLEKENMSIFADATCDMVCAEGVTPTHRYGTQFVDAVDAAGTTMRSLTSVSKTEFWKGELDDMILKIIFQNGDVDQLVADFNAHLVSADIASMG